MSNWTHIYAIVKIEQIFSFSKELITDFRENVINLLENAPNITGSEGNASVDIIKFTKTVWNYDKQDDENNVNCVYLAIIGDLRDREINQTTKEYNDFVNYFSCDEEFSVEVLTIDIN